MTRVHLITGFLGTGKTTTILHLLSIKPAGEKWAVLVNEFGELGIDGAILKTTGVAVREVAGGCLCCVSGLPFQMGLNMLLAREKPDVLLIEPTGLGHPKKILAMLQGEAYHDLIQMGASLCLLDARHLGQKRYLQSEVFHDQMQIADVLVANKADLYAETERAAFAALLARSKASGVFATQGQIALEVLSTPFDPARSQSLSFLHKDEAQAPLKVVFPLGKDEPFRRLVNQGQGYFSLGWLLKAEPLFVARKVRDWLSGLEVERAKGLLCTDEGARIFNLREGVLSEMPTKNQDESRLELIDSAPLDAAVLEAQLLALLNSTP